MRACRTWEVIKTKDGWRLKGNYSHIWPTSYVKAGKPPAENNTYGIYAYADLKYFYNPLSPSIPSSYYTVLSGIIETGGREVIHEDGRIRAEYCSITCIFYDDSCDKSIISALQEHYKIPFYDYQEFIAMVIELGLTKLSEAQKTSGIQITETPGTPHQYSECIPYEEPNVPPIRIGAINVALEPLWLKQIIYATAPQNKFRPQIWPLKFPWNK